ncbi:hypothetical protein SCP_1203730 [Sparassis crispa]|uniref:HNH nuclease domain-containing protein n=1 Tax=Sparassis crispa TaxID=139825 RepID=A0A401H170_9APHY|nr:hypothetical protein SCP_1203730 [Sparassis crispa]GBE88143.1 hypothetical protein SCP_1203730 [Sparassis crispa]
MSKLPRELPEDLQCHSEQFPHLNSAYQICLRLEEEIEADASPAQNSKEQMIFCRILGYLLCYGPNIGARVAVYKQIISCKDKKALVQLGKMYFDHYVRAFRSNKGPTPTPSNHASRPSLDTMADMIKDCLEEAPQGHSTAKNKALVRDGFRCVVTGAYDFISVMRSEELAGRARSEGVNLTYTECAHILSESTNLNTANSDKVWSIMNTFSSRKNLSDDLNGAKIHRLENVMTLEPSVHRSFDALEIWFIVTKTKNKYKLEGRSDLYLRQLPNDVTFTTIDPELLPVPSPDYLALHAACAKVAHLSGAAEYINKVLRDLEEMPVLSEDGSSARLLEDALLHASSRSPVWV